MTSPKPELNLRKRPRQARSVVMVDTILEAAARILETDGLPMFNMNAIASRAGVSVGSVYQYFPDKGAVIRELVRRKRADLVSALERQQAQIQGLDLPTVLDRFIRIAIANQLDRPRLARILEYVEAVSATDPQTETIKQNIVAMVAIGLADRGVADPTTAARDIVALTRGMVDAGGLFGDTDIVGLEDRIRRAAYGYLGLDLPSHIRQVPLPSPPRSLAQLERRHG